MSGQLRYCTCCGRAFLCGIFPQSTCEHCAAPVMWTNKDGCVESAPPCGGTCSGGILRLMKHKG